MKNSFFLFAFFMSELHNFLQYLFFVRKWIRHLLGLWVLFVLHFDALYSMLSKNLSLQEFGINKVDDL